MTYSGAQPTRKTETSNNNKNNNTTMFQIWRENKQTVVVDLFGDVYKSSR